MIRNDSQQVPFLRTHIDWRGASPVTHAAQILSLVLHQKARRRQPKQKLGLNELAEVRLRALHMSGAIQKRKPPREGWLVCMMILSSLKESNMEQRSCDLNAAVAEQ